MRHWLSWIEYLATNQGVGGSNPSWRARRDGATESAHSFFCGRIFVSYHKFYQKI